MNGLTSDPSHPAHLSPAERRERFLKRENRNHRRRQVQGALGHLAIGFIYTVVIAVVLLVIAVLVVGLLAAIKFLWGL